MTLAALVLAAVPASARAQVQVGVPSIQKPIDNARNAVAKTNEQTKAAERAEQAMKAEAATQKQATQKQATPPSPGQATKAAPAPAAAGRGAQAPGRDSASTGGRRGEVTLYREVFTYAAGSRRDPFVSLMLSGELRPILSDLSVTGITHDPEGRRSVALLVDASTGDSYRVRVGQTLGRMKVAAIAMESVTLTIDEFGLSRSETLVIDKSRKAGAAPAPRRP
ncbi:MAG: pilus assembly protein PilP [Gemmatimonadetes bacterium]|nr:pilus assembly protein PilP [Gemmatimonadota bacterium]